jgi:hypothetical protein
MIKEIKKSFLPHQSSLFDSYFLDEALEEMMPKSENDFNNFKDTIFDKYNRPGYLIQREKYYLFQPFDENTDVPMYYRENINIELCKCIEKILNFNRHIVFKGIMDQLYCEPYVLTHDAIIEKNRQYMFRDENQFLPFAKAILYSTHTRPAPPPAPTADPTIPPNELCSNKILPTDNIIIRLQSNNQIIRLYTPSIDP